jgi:hypothetical protein
MPGFPMRIFRPPLYHELAVLKKELPLTGIPKPPSNAIGSTGRIGARPDAHLQVDPGRPLRCASPFADASTYANSVHDDWPSPVYPIKKKQASPRIGGRCPFHLSFPSTSPCSFPLLCPALPPFPSRSGPHCPPLDYGASAHPPDFSSRSSFTALSTNISPVSS